MIRTVIFRTKGVLTKKYKLFGIKLGIICDLSCAISFCSLNGWLLKLIRNEQTDEKSDVYSFGVVLWEIITGKIPLDDLKPMQVIAAVGFMNRRLEIPKDVHPLWASLIESCWYSEPQSRPTFQEILVKLKELQKKYTVERIRR
ncbi:mitogen-activated protein kinase kinase kinase 19-like protein isoform X1 [Tanacetum coccineum]